MCENRDVMSLIVKKLKKISLRLLLLAIEFGKKDVFVIMLENWFLDKQSEKNHFICKKSL